MNLITHLQTQFLLPSYKKGNKILIKKSHRGKFTEYCDGKVTEECIDKGKKSKDPKIRKLATFALNARKWKHLYGGVAATTNSLNNVLINGSAMTPEELQKKQLDALMQDSQRQKLEELKQLLHQQDVQNTYNKIYGAAQQIGTSIANYTNARNNMLNEQAETQTEVFKEALKNEKNKDAIEALNKGTMTLDQFSQQTGIDLNKRAKRRILEDNANYTNNIDIAGLNLIWWEDYNKFHPNVNYNIPVSPILKQGKKLIKHPSTHNTKSILDDTGVIDEKTLKIKKYGL